MFDLPWWLFGSVPSDEEIEEGKELIKEEEVQSESQNCTPIKNYQTPLKQNLSRVGSEERNCVESSDPNPELPTLDAFLASVSRRSSLAHENPITENGDRRSIERNETDSTKKKKRSKKSLNRSETEVMQKSVDGQELIKEDPFFGLPSGEEPESHSADANQDLNHSLDNSFELNEAIHDNDGDKNTEVRDFPMFFTSFDDTTVLFNTTIRGDIELDKYQKEADIGNWVLKGNKFLEQNTQIRDDEDEENKKSPFKAPTPLIKRHRSKSAKKLQKKSDQEGASVSKSAENVAVEPVVKRTRHSKRTAKESEKVRESSSETSVKRLNDKPSTPKVKLGSSIPGFTRRLTPSRKAKENVVFYGQQ